MSDRPYVLLSAAMSVDGYIDDSSAQRLVLSGAADADRVDALRAGADAIMVGAGTIRRDNPSLLVKSRQRRAERLARGLAGSPVKVTVSATGHLDPAARFFADDGVSKLVYVPGPAAAGLRRRLGGTATVIAPADWLALGSVLADLAGRGVSRLMVEGGSLIHTEFLAAGLADELQLAVAPVFVGDPAAPRFVGTAPFPHGPGARMELAEVGSAGDMVVVRYLLRSPA